MCPKGLLSPNSVKGSKQIQTETLLNGGLKDVNPKNDTLLKGETKIKGNGVNGQVFHLSCVFVILVVFCLFSSVFVIATVTLEVKQEA